MRTDPPLSVPNEMWTCRQATDTAEPPLEPPAERAVSHGVTVVPKRGLTPVAPSASSCMLFLPMHSAPASRIAVTTQASDEALLLSSSLEPAVVARPTISILSFTAYTQPSSGPPAGGS